MAEVLTVTKTDLLDASLPNILELLKGEVQGMIEEIPETLTIITLKERPALVVRV